MPDETTPPPAPKWGDPISNIPPERQAELTQLAEAQRAWLAGPAVGGSGPDRDPNQSPLCLKWVIDSVWLKGAEIFFLAAEAYATEQGIALDEAERAVRERRALSLTNLHLEGAYLREAHLEHANLAEAHLEGADLGAAHLEGASLFQAHLERASLRKAQMEGATFTMAHLEGASLLDARLEETYLPEVHLEGAFLIGAHLERANLTYAHLEGADLSGAHLEGADLSYAHLGVADLRGAFFSTATELASAAIADEQHGAVHVADVRWQDVNLAVMRQWREIEMLGDEQRARKLAKQPLPNPDKSSDPLPKRASRAERAEAREERRRHLLRAWDDAARANRQLASVMRAQGMNDEADRFAYRGQVCQRQVYRYSGEPARRAFSWFLDLIAGYGYEPGRSLIAYVLIILGFALAFHFVGPLEGHPFYYDGALIFSVTSFHGRGFFPGGLNLENWITRLAALEAILGLLIEISFIATFTQRFFGR